MNGAVIGYSTFQCDLLNIFFYFLVCFKAVIILIVDCFDAF